MRELIQRKDSLVAQRATPPYFIQAGSCTLSHSVAVEPALPKRRPADISPHPAWLAQGEMALAAIIWGDSGRPAQCAAST